MASIRRLSLHQQTVQALCDGLQSGRWAGALPGVRPLAAELGVAIGTVQRALKELEADGFLETQGAGRRRVVAADAPTVQMPAHGTRKLRVGILPRIPVSEYPAPIQCVLLKLCEYLKEAGHYVTITPPQVAGKDSVAWLQRLVAETAVEAWIVLDAKRQVLETVAASGIPLLAVGGDKGTLSVSVVGAYVGNARAACTRALCELGHRRIVLIEESGSLQEPFRPSIQSYRDALAEAGIVPSEYNHPIWQETPAGMRDLLQSLFRLTPPTALIVSENHMLWGVLGFLLERGLSVPRDVSLVALCETEVEAKWFAPSLARVHLDFDRMKEFMIRWVEDVAAGHREPVECVLQAEFIPGGTIGPVPKS